MRLRSRPSALVLIVIVFVLGAGFIWFNVSAPPEAIFTEVSSGLSEGGAAPVPASSEVRSQLPPSERLVLRSATLRVQVAQVSTVEAELRAHAEQLGGYVVSVETQGSDANMTSTIVFRVPAEHFDAALNTIEGLSLKVLSRSVSGEDVTEEFVDLESRLRNLEATRDRMIDLLARADEVEAALQVSRALSEVQGEIEQIQGRMKFLSQSAALSTIRADLVPEPPLPSLATEDSWQPVRIALGAFAGLMNFGRSLVNVLIVVLVWTPVWLPTLLFVRWGWRRYQRKQAQTAPEPKS